MLKRIGAALAAFALVIVGLFGLASPAQADDGCAPDRLCFFDGGLFHTRLAMINPCCVSVGVCHNLVSSAVNRTDAIVNSTDWEWRVYTGTNCTGTPGPIFARSQGNMTGVYLDSIDSYAKWVLR